MQKLVAAARTGAGGESGSKRLDALIFALCILGCAGAVGSWLATYATTLG
jgi:hypothetical protein